MLQIEAYNFHAVYPELVRQMLRSSHRTGDLWEYPTPIAIVVRNPVEVAVAWDEIPTNPIEGLVGAVCQCAGVLPKFSVSPLPDLKMIQAIIDLHRSSGACDPGVQVVQTGTRIFHNTNAEGRVTCTAVQAIANATGHFYDHLLVLQQFIAKALQKDPGTFTLFVHRMIATSQQIERAAGLIHEFNVTAGDHYRKEVTHTTNVFDVEIDRWISEVRMAFSDYRNAMGYTSTFVRRVLLPIVQTIEKKGPGAPLMLSSDWHYSIDRNLTRKDR